MNNTMFLELSKKYKSLNNQIKELEQQKKNVKKLIRIIVTEADLYDYTYSGTKVNII